MEQHEAEILASLGRWDLIETANATKAVGATEMGGYSNSVADNPNRAGSIQGGVYDAGLHYRKSYKGIKLDPFRISAVYGCNGVQLTILKKVLVTGERGHKDEIQDYKDIINAATRAIEMITEDMQDDN